MVIIFSGVSWTSTASADDTVCVPRLELEQAEDQLDQALKNARACIAEAHSIRSARDICLGRRDQIEIQLRAKGLELMDLNAKNHGLQDELESRWPAWIWLGIGIALPVGGVIAWELMD